MTSRDVLINFVARFESVHKATQSVIEELRQVGRAFRDLNRFSEGMAQFRIAAGIERDAEKAKLAIDQLVVNLQKLRALQQQLSVPGGRAGAQPADLIPQPRDASGRFRAISKGDVDLQILKQEQAINDLILATDKQRILTRQQMAQLLSRDLELSGRVLANVSGQAFMEERLNRIRKNDPLKEVLEERLRLLQANEAEIQKNISALEQSALIQLGGRKGDKIARDRANAERASIQAQRDIDSANRQLEANRGRLAEAQAKKSKDLNRLQAEEVRLLDQRVSATKRLADAQRQLEGPTQELEQAINLGGASPLMENLREQARINREAQLSLTPADASPKLVEMLARFQQIDRQLTLVKGNTAAENKLLEEQRKLVGDIERERREAPSRGLQEVESNEDFRQRQLAQLPGLERAFIGAFDDMGRRFQATLQFAISGALIFGAQQLARRFLETAIEVERAFADIGTAFEFDIEAPRGTIEFNQQLGLIRLRVLDLSDQFNVLPTEANKAAFSMVSRFGDVNDAMTALRAQLLATKISTIDQAEALRALSAVAENFAAAQLHIDDGLTIQEKLFKREQAAVGNYGKALDIATTLQQRFGVEVEDTLEGVSRLSPTFARMGFSMEQTAAIVASISRELGLAGSAVADSVNRSLGQLVEPSTRDALLDLAAANSNLTLTFDDFVNGERALSALVEQFRNLEEVDPGTAFQVLNILGQRRELDVVAALFNTTELQDAMGEALNTAAGSAEARFDILAATISERLASIGSGFERLAQNFTELGFLEPIKLAVAAFDELLQKVNQFLETINQIITELGTFGTVLKGAVAIGLATRTVGRVAGLLANTASFGATAFARAAQKGAASVGNRGVGLLADTATTVAGELKLLAGQVKNNRIGMFALVRGLYASTAAFLVNTRSVIANSVNQSISTAVSRLTTRFPGLERAFLRLDLIAVRSGTTLAGLLGRLGILAGVVTAVVAGLDGMKSAMTAVEGAVDGFRNASLAAEAQVRKEQLEDPDAFPVEESARRRLIELTEQNLAEQSANLDSFFERLFLGAVSMTETSKEGVDQLREIIKEVQGGQIDPMQEFEIQRLVPGTQEFIDRRDQELTRLRIAAAVKEMLQQAIAGGVNSLNFGDFTQLGAKDLAEELISPGAAFIDEANNLMTQVRSARSQVDVDNAVAAAAALGASWAELEDSLKGTIAQIEGTAKSTGDRVRDAQRSFGVGRLSRADLIEQIRLGEVTTRALANQVAASKTAGARERARELFEEADRLLVELLQAELAVFDFDRQRAELLTSTTGRLEAQLVAAQNALAKLIEKGTEDDVVQQELEIARLQRDLANAYKERARGLAEAAVAIAQTNEEWFAAQNVLIELLRREAIQAIETLDPEVMVAATNAWKQAEIDKLDRFIDVGKRERIAAARLNGPINDKLNQLDGQIAAVRFEIANTKDSLKQLELTVQLRELLVQRIQEEISRMQAFVEVQAGANDQISLLKGSIVVAIEEIDIAAQAWGTLSSEFNQAKVKLADLKFQLANALLSLADINRRLGSDLSNSFEQAILDLQLIAEKLQAPDLGELEKAQLLLDRFRGEMAAQQAFFSTELFNLRFLSETGQLGTGAYVSALQSLLAQVDTSTQQGKEIFLEIQGLIDGMTEDVSNLAFNIPTAIRLPTIFEVRRALAADQLGVNYVDNRQMDIVIDVRDATDVEALVAALGNSLGSVTLAAGRYAPGASSLTLGGF